MHYRRRPGSPLSYVLVVIASVVFAVVEPSFSSGPQFNALGLVDLSWISNPSH